MQRLVSSVMVFLMLGGAGCATIRTEFVAPNGKPLSVYDKTHVKHATVESQASQAATGNCNARCSDEWSDCLRNKDHATCASKAEDCESACGERPATYENVTYTEREVYAMQGSERIDEESFYRMAKDQDAIRRYDEYHQKGASTARTGGIITVIGAAVAVAGASVLLYGKITETPEDDKLPFTYGGAAGLSLGGVGAIVGYVVMGMGKEAARAKDAEVIKDPGRMKRDARVYNKSLGLERSLPVQKNDEPPKASPPPPRRSPGRRAGPRP